MAMNATTATPTVSAPAVIAVRAGLRLVFSRASSPAAAASLTNGIPITVASGAISHRETTVRPTNRSAAPPPSSSSRAAVESPLANRPTPSRLAPVTPTAASRGLPARASGPGGRVAPSRTVAIGAMDPIPRWLLVAVCSSTAISPGPVGRCPAMTVVA
jgi:hypothetical protein